jgi:type I restriction enzyme R subunit
LGIKYLNFLTLLRAIARELVKAVRGNVSIDWTERETVRAKLRAIVISIIAKNKFGSR